jgi:hypothetical protein
MNKTLLIAAIIVVILLGAVGIWKLQAGTPALTQQSPQPSSTLQGAPSQTSSSWDTFSNSELGVSFSFPTGTLDSPLSGGTSYVRSGTNGGRAFGANLYISGPSISIYAYTTDFSNPKNGAGEVGNGGYIIKNGQYYEIQQGKAARTPFVPAELWPLSDGSNAAVTYAVTSTPTGDPTGAVALALVNLHGPKFTGMGFILGGYNDSTGWHLPNADAFATFKKIVTSIQFLN